MMHTMFKLFSTAISYVASFCIYPSYTEIQHIWSYTNIEITCQKERFVTFEIIRTHRVQDIVRKWHVADRNVCVIAYSRVKIWPCTLSGINRQLHLNLQEMKNCITFSSSSKYRAHLVLWYEKYHGNRMSFNVIRSKI